MKLVSPRFVVLDTATINTAAGSPGDAKTEELLVFLKSGAWIPFVTYHHLEEIACHGSHDLFGRRFDFLQRLPLVAYLNKPTEGDTVGDSIYLRDYEIEFLTENQHASHADVIAAVGPEVRSGLSSGEQLVKENLQWWRFFHEHFAAASRRQKAEIANLTHFPPGNPKERIPAKGDSVWTWSEPEAQKRFGQLARVLERQIRAHGDCRDFAPESAARDLMRESFEELRHDLAAGEHSFEAMLTHFGVERSRLPSNARTEDVGYEAIFDVQMGVHARRLLKNKEELVGRVLKERIPSWFVWQEVDRRIRQLPNAEIGNVNDKHILAFGLYVDLLNVDKPIAEVIRQAASHHKLLRELHSRVPVGRGLDGLLDAMRNN